MTQMEREINLFDLFESIKKYIKKNIWLLIVLALIGSGIGFVWHKYQKPKYVTYGVFSTWIEEGLLVKIMELMEKQFEIKNYDFMSKHSDVEAKNLSNIISIEYFISDKSVKKGIDYFDFIEAKSFITLEVTSTSEKMFPWFKVFLLSYFDNNNNLSELLQQRINLLKSLFVEIEYEIDYYKSRNELIFDKLDRSNANLFIDYKPKELLELIKLKFEIEHVLTNEHIIKFSQDFSDPIKQRKSLALNMIIFSIIFLITGMIIRSLIFLRK
jgi:hypothetical protein